MEESARISRGQIRDLRECTPDKFDAVIFPGGYGAAKNLCTFAKDGDKLSVRDDVENVVKTFREHNKPIGMCCIAPVIAAKVLTGCEVTIGNDPGVSQAIANLV